MRLAWFMTVIGIFFAVGSCRHETAFSYEWAGSFARPGRASCLMWILTPERWQRALNARNDAYKSGGISRAASQGKARTGPDCPAAASCFSVSA